MLWLAPAVTAQQPASSANVEIPTFTSDVKVVNVLATVRDKKGKIVSGLSQSDFLLEEDGKAQPIRYFARETSLPLTLGLLIDTSRSMRNELDKERSASKTFVDQVLRPEKDKAFLVHFDREVELLQDLTGSQQDFNNALEKLQTASMPSRSEDAPQTGSGQRPEDGEDRRSGPRGGRPPRMAGTTLYDAVFLATDEILKKPQGRKAIILISDGVDRGSKTTLEHAIETAQRSDTLVYTVYLPGEQAESGNRGFSRRGSGGGMGRRPGIGYPGGGYPGGSYPRGGYPGGGYPDGNDGGGYPGGGRGEQQHPDGKKILQRIAQETGGYSFQVSKKQPIEQIYKQIQEELRNQYNLGYSPEHATGSAEYHRITLTTKTKNLQVQARQGYYSEK